MNYILDFIWTFFYGVIEGITEWLPVSSTGHLIIFQNLWKHFDLTDPHYEAFFEMFDVVIQLGAILAVVVIFWKKLWPFHIKKIEQPVLGHSKPSGIEKFLGKFCYMDKIVLWLKRAVACLPAAVIGLLFDDWLDENFKNVWVVAIALIVYGVLFIVIENWRKGKTNKFNDVNDITFKVAMLIGCFQLLSLIPGTSRSGSTILGAMILFCSRTAGAEFSFFLGIPVMFGASGLKVVKYFLKGNTFSSYESILLVFGMVVAFVVSMLSIRFLMNFVKKHDFKGFGYYRIAVGAVLLALGFAIPTLFTVV